MLPKLYFQRWGSLQISDDVQVVPVNESTSQLSSPTVGPCKQCCTYVTMESDLLLVNGGTISWINNRDRRPRIGNYQQRQMPSTITETNAMVLVYQW